MLIYIFLIPCDIVPTTEENILENDDSSSQSRDLLLFSMDKFHYLNAARVGSSLSYDDFDCTFKCLRNSFCLSINLAASKNDANGKLWCELLSSDRYKHSLDYKENRTSHHLFLLVECVLLTRWRNASWFLMNSCFSFIKYLTKAYRFSIVSSLTLGSRSLHHYYYISYFS